MAFPPLLACAPDLRDDSGMRWLPLVAAASLAAIVIACGGGGYGDPRLRDPARVRHDVAEGLVTARRAAEVYGVEPGET